jgi:hypothetical protein
LFDRSFVLYSVRGRLRVGDCHEVIEFWQSIPVPRRSMGSFSLPQIGLGRLEAGRRINGAIHFSSGKCDGAVNCDQNLPPRAKRLSKAH